MPKTDAEADAIARRKFKIKFWKNAGGEFGKWGVRLLFLIIAIIIIFVAANYIFDLALSPFRWIGGAAESTGSAIGATWDHLPDWVPGADDANAPPAPEPVAVPAETGDSEPGWICSHWTKWNPGC